MSEGVSAVFRPNQPPALKRRRAEDSDSGGSTGRSGCRYQACRRRPGNGGGAHHPFCSPTHRDFYMADLFDMWKKYGGTLVTEHPEGKCKLYGCPRPVWEIAATGEAFDFCGRSHALKYKEAMTEEWDLENRLCKFEPCTSHVDVDETSQKAHDYCCRDHAFKAAAARGMKKAAAKRRQLVAAKGLFSDDPPVVEPVRNMSGGKDPSSSNAVLEKGISQGAPHQEFQAKTEKERGYHERISNDVMENCLRHLLLHPKDFLNLDPSGLFCIVNDIIGFHPFDEVTEFGGFMPRYYLHYMDSSPGRQRSTKQGFAWKQTSDVHKNKRAGKMVETTYFSYELREKGGSKNDNSDGHVLAYRQYEEDKKTGKLRKGTIKRWKLNQHFPSDEFVLKVTGGQLPSERPVISRIFQDKRGLPEVPLPQRKENYAIEGNEKNTVTVGNISEATFDLEEMGMTSSNSSNASPPGEGLPLGGEPSQGQNSSENKETDDLAIPQDTAMTYLATEVTGNESSPPVPMGTFPDLGLQGEDMGMISNSSSCASLHEGQRPMNLYCWPSFDHSKVGGDNISCFMNFNFPSEGQEVMWSVEQEDFSEWRVE